MEKKSSSEVKARVVLKSDTKIKRSLSTVQEFLTNTDGRDPSHRAHDVLEDEHEQNEV